MKTRILRWYRGPRQPQSGGHRRLPLGYCLALLFVVTWTGWAQDLHLQKGVELLRQGRYDAALPEIEQAGRAHPQNAAIENALGLIHTQLGNVREANRHYEKAIRLAPDFAEPHKNLGFNYLNRKDYTSAEQQLKVAARLEPGDPFVHYYLARLYLATARDREAVEQLPPAEQLLGNDPQASFEMAEACLRLNETKASLALIDALERRSALSVSQEYQLAVLLFDKQMYSPAIDLLRRMTQADPGSWIDRYNLAIGLLGNKQPGEAVSVLEPLATARPHEAAVLDLLGAAYEADGKPDKALEAYEMAVRADPQDPNPYLDYTRLLMEVGRYDESQHTVEAGLKLASDPYALEMRLGSVRMMAGKLAEARTSFQKAIDAHPEIALAYVALAQIYLREQQNEEAAKVLAEARRKLPHQFVLEYYYGQTLMRLGRTDEATALLEESVSLNPGVPEAHFELGKAYWAANRGDAAIKQFERAIELAPQYVKPYYQLARIYKQRGEIAKARQMAERTAQLNQTQYESALRTHDSLMNRLREGDHHADTKKSEMTGKP